MGLGRGLGRGFKSIGSATARGLKYVETNNPAVRGVKKAFGMDPNNAFIDPDKMSNRDKQILGAFSVVTPGGWGPMGAGYAGQALNKVTGVRNMDDRVTNGVMGLVGLGGKKRKLGS